MTKSRSCYERLRSFLTRRRHEDSDGEWTDSCSCSNDIGDRHNNIGDDNSDGDGHVHYFNHAAQAPLSPEVQKLGIELIQSPPWKATDDRHSATANQAKIRSLFASLVDSDENEDADGKGSRIAMFPSTAFAITLAARNIAESHRRRSNSGGRILLLQDQFDSAVYPWQQVCDESRGKITLDIVGHPDDDDSDLRSTCGDEVSGWTAAVLNRIRDNGSEVIAACLPPLHWSDGTLLDLIAIGEACRLRNIPLIVDATQAIGAMPCSVRKIRPTLLACSTHKWLRGPSGCCLAYVSPEVQDNWLPLDFHGRGRDFEAGAASWDVSRNEMGPHGYPETFYGDARKFDSGGKANPLLLPMLRQAMEEVSLINVVDLQLTLKELLHPLMVWAPKNGYSINGDPRAYHIIGLVPKEKTPEEMLEIAKKLAEENGVILAVRCGGFRVSTYLTNTSKDVERLIEGLKEFS